MIAVRPFPTMATPKSQAPQTWRSALIDRLKDGEWHRVRDLLEEFSPTVPMEVATRHVQRDIKHGRYRRAAMREHLTTQWLTAKGRRAVVLHTLGALRVERDYRPRLLHVTPDAKVRLPLATCAYCGATRRAPTSYKAQVDGCSYYCNNSHRMLAAMRAQGRTPRSERPLTCERCGATFTSKQGRRNRFCSPACVYATHSAQRTRPRVVLPCAHCGTPFTAKPWRPTNRYCGKVCAMRGAQATRRAKGKHPAGREDVR